MRTESIAIGALLALLGAALWSSELRRAPSAPAAPQLDAARMRADLDRLVKGPRPIGSDAGEAARAVVLERLRALGLEARVESDFVCTRLGACGQAHNVVGEIPGDPERRPLVLSAHVDTVAASPGALDDGLGVVVVLEVARRLLDYGIVGRYPRPPITLLFTDGEEVGLLGARAYVQRHPERAKDAYLFVTVDGMGGPTTFSSQGPIDMSLVWSLARAARPFFSSLERLDFAPGGFDDGQVFAGLGVPAVTVGGRAEYARYHTDLDTPDAVAAATFADRGEATWRLVEGSFRTRELRPTDGAYGDVFGRPLFGLGLTWIAAVFGALMLIGAAWVGGEERPGRGALHIAVAITAVMALRVGLVALTGTTPSTAALGSLLGLLFAASALWPRDEAVCWGAQSGLALLALGGLALVMAVVLPRAAFAPIVAAMVLGLVAVLARGTAGLFGRTADVYVAGGATWAGAVVLTDQLAAFQQLGPAASGPPGWALAVLPELGLALLIAPMVALVARGRGPRAAAVAALAGVAAHIAFASPSSGASSTLRFVDDGAGAPGVAVFGASFAGLDALGEARPRAQLYPWSSGDYPVGWIPMEADAGPAPVVRTSTLADGVRVEVVPPPKTALLRLALSPKTPAARITVQGAAMPPAPDATRWTHGWRVISVHGPRGPVVFEVHREGGAQDLVFDVGALRSGLPAALDAVAGQRPAGLRPANLGDTTERRVLGAVPARP